MQYPKFNYCIITDMEYKSVSCVETWDAKDKKAEILVRRDGTPIPPARLSFIQKPGNSCSLKLKGSRLYQKKRSTDLNLMVLITMLKREFSCNSVTPGTPHAESRDLR